MNTIFEQTGGRCVQYGDYLFPDEALPDEEHCPIGKYGKMRQAYLREYHPGLYSRLILSGKLYEHLTEVEHTCQERLETMIPQMAKQQGVTEELKARDQLGWVIKYSIPRWKPGKALSCETYRLYSSGVRQGCPVQRLFRRRERSLCPQPPPCASGGR